MKSEYVRLKIPERLYGRKNFYYVQLEILNLVKSLKNYRELRANEHAMKVLLKIKIGEAITFLDKLEKLLPNVYLEHHKSAEKEEKEMENLTIEQEIEQIKDKIMKLQLGF